MLDNENVPSAEAKVAPELDPQKYVVVPDHTDLVEDAISTLATPDQQVSADLCARFAAAPSDLMCFQ
jgi:hypothetical protein